MRRRKAVEGKENTERTVEDILSMLLFIWLFDIALPLSKRAGLLSNEQWCS